MDGVTAKAALTAVLQQIPELTAHGLGPGRPIRADEFVACVGWIRRNAVPTKTIRRRTGSYGLKHEIEKAADKYVTNGACIAAMVHSGFRFEPVGVGNPNVYFNLAARRALAPRE